MHAVKGWQQLLLRLASLAWMTKLCLREKDAADETAPQILGMGRWNEWTAAY